MEKGFLLVAVVPVCFFQCGLLFSHSTCRLAFNPATSAIAKNRKVTAAWTRSIDMFIITVK